MQRLRPENRPVAYAIAIVWAVLALAAVTDVKARKAGMKLTLGGITQCVVDSLSSNFSW